MVGSDCALETEGWGGSGPAGWCSGICSSIRGSASRFSAPGLPKLLLSWLPCSDLLVSCPIIPWAPSWAEAASWEGKGSDRARQRAPHLPSLSPADPMGEEHYAGGASGLPAFLVVVRVRLVRAGHGVGLGGGEWGNHRPPLPPTACSGTCTVQRPTAERHASTRVKPRPSRTM